ncbi:response regulator transcription factor [Streptomyces sp. NPDC001985]|uniref:response regulator transcription factor n=1 Tax=Streptomyces sp. NPDC001985 TaxID=3154406 RepID=UPI0033322C17
MARSSLREFLPASTGTAPSACSIVLVGPWSADAAARIEEGAGAGVHHCPDRQDLLATVHARRADWILAGAELDDGDIQYFSTRANTVRESVRLAILGRGQDWRRCERWMRRGCRVYLDETVTGQRAIAALRAAHTLGVNVIDGVFSEALRARAAGPAPHLTRRERDVLDLLRRGLRNREIAGALFLSENTVEYHMRHLLTKFSARNRVEVVERATALGLA